MDMTEKGIDCTTHSAHTTAYYTTTTRKNCLYCVHTDVYSLIGMCDAFVFCQFVYMHDYLSAFIPHIQRFAIFFFFSLSVKIIYYRLYKNLFICMN